MAYVLEHELVHIRRLDALWKPLLALTACVHWFNPLAWAMYVLHIFRWYSATVISPYPSNHKDARRSSSFLVKVPSWTVG